MTSPHQPQDHRDHGADQHSDRDAASGSVEAHGSPLIADPWRDITSAPKDGEDFLAWSNWLGFIVVQFDEGNVEFPWATLDGPNYFKNAFTDWTPLPAPPGDA